MKPSILLLCSLFTLCAQALQYAEPNRPYRFEFNEARWEIVAASKQAPTQDVDKAMEGRTLTTLQRKEADEKYRSRVSVVVDDATKVARKGETDLAAYAEHAAEFLKSQRFSILSTETKILPLLGTPAVEIIANQRDFGLTFRQLVFVWDKSGKKEAYLVTAATRTNHFDSYKAELDALFNSLAMK